MVPDEIFEYETSRLDYWPKYVAFTGKERRVVKVISNGCKGKK